MADRIRTACLGLIAVLGGCTSVEYSIRRDERLDVFHQTRRRAVDLLLVVDNSCSMLDEQDHLAESFDALIAAMDQAESDWRIAVTTSEPTLPEFRGKLAGGDDEIVLVGADGVELDRVEYDDERWAIDPGTALARCEPAGAPDDPAGWLRVPLGTPGQSDCGPPSIALTEAGPRPAAPQEVVISEFLPWPADDPSCEWVELANRTTATLDLSGAALRDEGRNRAVLPEGTEIGPGKVLLLGRASQGCDLPLDVPLQGFSLAQGERFIGRETADAAAVFSELVAVGTQGFGLEMGMENALLTLRNPASAEVSGGFLRDDADLALLFFSDEDDLSPDPIAAYVDAFRALKGDAGYRERGRVRLGAAVGTALEGSPGDPCEGNAVYAERYLAMAEVSGGLAWSICEDLSQVADQAGVTFSEQIVEFQLSGVPALDTLLVEEYASKDDDSLLGRMVAGRDFGLEVRTEDDGEGGVWMVFPEDRVAPDHYVVVHYEALPDSVALETGPLGPALEAQ